MSGAEIRLPFSSRSASRSRDPRLSWSADLLRWPLVGSLLRWRHARTALQLCGLLAATIIVLHGLFGPQVGPRNLATVVTWVHYRGLLVVALLAAGNFFCTGCPFVLVRDMARRQHRPTRRWPRWLRNKWIGIALFAGVLFAYELFDLWALPRATAWLVLGYFGAALAIDLVFTGATFCKHLCPIGQFNFAASTLSPLEVMVRDRDVCRSCRTSDCIKGRRAPDAPGVTIQRGCELGLFLPSKVGNLDCTFCLDCVQACPHDNIMLASRAPGAELAETRRRSGIGRLAQRPDIAALAV
ncbi:MAG: 4Fe-4S binding protein, partial [Vicinamibacterales bacterium]